METGNWHQERHETKAHESESSTYKSADTTCANFQGHRIEQEVFRGYQDEQSTANRTSLSKDRPFVKCDMVPFHLLQTKSRSQVREPTKKISNIVVLPPTDLPVWQGRARSTTIMGAHPDKDMSIRIQSRQDQHFLLGADSGDDELSTKRLVFN